jgi:hypothetical protein
VVVENSDVFILLGFKAERRLSGINQLGEVLNTAGGPLVDVAVVVHDASDAGAGSVLGVNSLNFGVIFEVVQHAEVVSKLVSHSLSL